MNKKEQPVGGERRASGGGGGLQVVSKGGSFKKEQSVGGGFKSAFRTVQRERGSKNRLLQNRLKFFNFAKSCSVMTI